MRSRWRGITRCVWGSPRRFVVGDLLDGVRRRVRRGARQPALRGRAGEELAPEISRYEPAAALFAGPDGLDVIAAADRDDITDLCGRGRYRPAMLGLEVGFDQAAAVEAMLARPGFGRCSGCGISPGTSAWWSGGGEPRGGGARGERGRGGRAVSEAEAFERCMAVGGVALFPADTVYGLACDPANRIAVERLYLLKRRELDKPSAVMFFDVELALESLPELGPRTREAIAELLPGAVTLLLPNPAGRFPLACGDDPGTLGMRVVRSEALDGVRWPVLQSSANRAGGRRPAPARGGARVHPPRRRHGDRRRRAAGDAVDGDRPARVRGGRRRGRWCGRGRWPRSSLRPCCAGSSTSTRRRTSR